jgi:hypothetical protein
VSPIYNFRTISQYFCEINKKPLTFTKVYATILLFISIDPSDTIPLVNRALIIQVIILTALFMMVGLMLHQKPKTEELEDQEILETAPKTN